MADEEGPIRMKRPEERQPSDRLAAIPRVVVPVGDAVRASVEASKGEDSKRRAGEMVVVSTFQGFRDAIEKNGDFNTKRLFQNSELNRLLS
ncbi:MAG: hypothetical protein ABH842_02405 [Candidatus Micrarchaeota archaeon]